MTPDAKTTNPPRPRRMGRVNWTGLRTLYAKEVRRFVKVHTQTIWAPVATTLLFYAVFSLALGGTGRDVGGIPYLNFLAPGLVVMAMAQNAFANTSSSLVISKVQGNIVDVLMPPLSAAELTLAYVGGGVTRGAVVGLAASLAISVFAPMGIENAFFVIYHGIMASTLLSLLGVIGGVWSEKFDHIAAVTNFVVTPAAFLSGTFYSIERLPPFFQAVAHANPFFYMIDGFRYGFIGRADGDLATGLLVLFGVNAALFALALRMIGTGYKLKA